MLIDTHAHINFVVYKDDGDQVVKRALENQVWIINSGSQWETSRRAVAYAKKYPQGVYASIGLQPIHLSNLKIKEQLNEQELLDFETREEKFKPAEYRDLAADPKVVAIGEAGLDYNYLKLENLKEQERLKNLQKEVFCQHLEIAEELKKPIVVHCREAHNDVIEILQTAVKSKRLTVKGTVHSFLGRWSQAQQYLEMGFYLGFNGIITFARDYDKVIINMPLERILLETDCPYLTPAPFRGQRNEPAYVKYVAEKIAELRGISFDEVAKVTTENARGLFKI